MIRSMLRRIATTIGYLLFACLIVFLTIGLVAYGQDYSYSFSKHKIVRSGNVIIQAIPSGVTVTLDGRNEQSKTSYRLETGPSYAFSVAKAGFHTWQKAITTLAGKVNLVQYIVLVPTSLAPQTLSTVAGVTGESVSHDRRHIVYITTGTDSAVMAYDFGSKPVKVYTPIAASPSSPAEVLTSVAFSDDASHIVVQSTIGAQNVTRLMASDGSGAINLTDSYKFDFTGLKFSSGNWRQLYWISPDGLRRLDVDSQTVSAVLAGNVKQFEILDGSVMYVQATPLGQSLWLLNGRSSKPQQIIAALAASDHYGIAYMNYRGDDVLGVVPSATGVGTLYTSAFSDTPKALTLAQDVSDVSFSPDGHFVDFSGPHNMTTYDLDASNILGTSVRYDFPVADLSVAPVWFDSYHVLLTENNHLMWRDFDGSNGVDLGIAAGALAPSASADLRSVYLWRPVSSQLELSQLTIKP
jgi:WD40 repeat protein